jgi:hypothetical protein
VGQGKRIFCISITPKTTRKPGVGEHKLEHSLQTQMPWVGNKNTELPCVNHSEWLGPSQSGDPAPANAELPALDAGHVILTDQGGYFFQFFKRS